MRCLSAHQNHPNYWWLRSPYTGVVSHYSASRVRSDGDLGYYVVTNSYGLLQSPDTYDSSYAYYMRSSGNVDDRSYGK